MNFRKFFRQIFSAWFIVSILFCNTVSHAEIKNYEGYGEYYIVGDETNDFAKKQAELEAWRNILDKICVYVKGQSTMIDNELDEDEIITIAAGILRVVDTKHTIAVEDDTLIVKAFVTATIDTDELESLLDNAIKNQ